MKILSTVTAILLLFTAIFSQQSTAIIPELDCSEPIDIFFALDASDSLTQAEFNLEKNLVIQLLQRLIDGGRDAQAGFLTFTTQINNVQDLAISLELVKFALNNVVFDREGTSLLAPLTYVHDNIFSPTNSNLREGSRKLFFLITDGEDESSTLMQLTDISRSLEERNVTIITMGIGTLTSTVQLSEIASMPHAQNLLLFSDLNEALANVSNIIDRTCTIPVVILESVTVESTTSVTITWTSYTFAAVSVYKVCLTLEMRGCNISQDVNSTLNSITVDNLVPNTLYSVSVFAVTDLGVTPTSIILQAMTLENLGIPIDLTATSVTSSSITLTWGMATSGSASSMYEICFSLTSGGSCVEMNTVDASIQPLEYVQENLDGNTAYYIRIRGVTSGATGEYSTEILATTEVSGGPTLLTVVSVLYNVIQATWSDYGNGASYEVCVRLQGQNDCVQNVSVAAGTTTTFISGLEAFTFYDVSLVAITVQGRSQASNTISLQTIATIPGAPASLNATAQSATEITVYWTGTPIEQHFGVITEYVVCVREVGEESCDFTLTHDATVMPFQVTQSDLKQNTTYSIRVRATNQVGLGEYTENFFITTEPLQAVQLTAVTDNVTTITLTWTDVNVQSGFILDGELAVSELPDGAAMVFSIIQADAILNEKVVAGLRAATKYYFILKFNTMAGTTPESNQAYATTDEGEPSGAPTNFTAESVSNTSARLTWGEVEEGLRNGVITTYTICYGTSENSCGTEIVVNAPLLEYTVNGLELGTMYYFRIRASTAVGLGPYSNTISHITSTPLLVIVYIRADSSSSIDLSWENLQVTVDRYEIIIREDGSMNGTVIQVNSITDVPRTSYLITGLKTYTLYYVIVRAVTPEGNINSMERSVRTNATFPDTSVTNITAIAVNSSTITISWDEVVEEDRNGVITKYDVCVEGAGGACVIVVTVYAPGTQVSISGLINDTEYSIIIRAYTSAGAGPYSQRVLVTTLPLAPAELTAIVTVENGPNVIIEGTFPQTGGPVTDVAVCVRVSGGTECLNISIVSDDVMFTANPDELEPNTDYEVVISVIGPGGTIELDPMPFTTLPELPKGPIENIESESSTTSISLNWTEPAYPNDDSLTYFITISREGVVISSIETTDTEVEIIGLYPNTLYNIIITPSNSVGNSTDVVIITVATEQEQPEPLEIVSVYGDSVLVRITPVGYTSNSIPIFNYEVCVMSTSGVCDRIIVVYASDNLTFIIDGLTENTEYSFTVVAYVEDHIRPGSFRASVPSEPVSVTIASIGAPNNQVTDLVVVINEPLIMNVSWNFNATSEENVPTHFYVCLALTLDGNCTITRQVTADVTSVEITEVEGDTLYYVRVYPENMFGFGPGAEVTVSTPEAPPSPVSSFGTAISPYEVLFEWVSNNVLLNISYYTICLYNADMSMCEQTVDRQNIYSGAIVFSDLTPNTSYTISILELEYVTEEATVVTTTLLDAYLDSPLNVLVSAISSTILRVTWVASQDTLSLNLTAWEVCFEAERFIDTSGCVTSDKNELYKSIIGLEEYEYYTITVRALYSNNAGTEFSVPVIGITEQDVPSRPISVLIDNDEDGIPKYFWTAPDLIYHNGIIIYYLVEFEYVENDLVKTIPIRADTINRAVIIPADVILPYNVAVTPYTIGAGPTYKLFGSKVEPQRAAAPCPDMRIVITILCVLFALLLILAIVLCCIILIIAVRKRTHKYSTV